jgi:hypothetical protein
MESRISYRSFVPNYGEKSDTVNPYGILKEPLEIPWHRWFLHTYLGVVGWKCVVCGGVRAGAGRGEMYEITPRSCEDPRLHFLAALIHPIRVPDTLAEENIFGASYRLSCVWAFYEFGMR